MSRQICSMDGPKGKSTGNHRFSHEIWNFPVFFPLNQRIESDFPLQLRFGVHETSAPRARHETGVRRGMWEFLACFQRLCDSCRLGINQWTTMAVEDM